MNDRWKQIVSHSVILFFILGVPLDLTIPMNGNNLVADAGGPYEASEGETITFDASGSQGPQGVNLQYRWDFEGDGSWDTTFSESPIATHTWSDDYAGTAYVEVQAPGGDVSAIEIIGSLAAGGGNVIGGEERGQSFVATFGLLTQVSLDVSLFPDEVPNAPLTLSIRSDVNGSNLTSSQVDGSGMPFGLVENWVVFDVPDLVLTLGNTYWVVLYSNATNIGYNPHCTLDAYPNGTAWGKGGGGAWVPAPTLDVRMMISGITGTAYDIDAASVTVLNLAPTFDIPLQAIDVAEGDTASLTATATDAGADDLVFTWVWGMGPSESFTFPNDGSFPFTVSDTFTHVYGDDGTYMVNLIVEDDDGGVATSEAAVTVTNVVPSVSLKAIPSGNEGETLIFEARTTDPGSDDLSYFWWGHCNGWASIPILYPNDPASVPDPYPSPDVNPRDVTDIQSVVCGDNGNYTWNVRVEDDDGGVTIISGSLSVGNLPPSLEVSPPLYIRVNEGMEVTLDATVADPGSDDLTFTWSWEYGKVESSIFYNDGVGPDPPNSPEGVYPFAIRDSSSNIYGDDGNFTIRLAVADDDGGMTTTQTIVVVDNVDPTISNISYDIFYSVPRTQGYWNFQCTEKLPSPDHVGIQEGFIEYVSSQSRVFSGISTKDEVCDYLGKLDNSNKTQKATQQLMAIWLNVASDKLNLSSEMFVPQLGMTINLWELIIWIEDTILNDRADNMETAKDLADEINNGNLVPYAVLTFFGAASDPGSDDLILTWSWGDGTDDASTVYYNDGSGPDPFPSPEINPMTILDIVQHSYSVAGKYSVSLTVSDDDGGEATTVLTILL